MTGLAMRFSNGGWKTFRAVRMFPSRRLHHGYNLCVIDWKLILGKFAPFVHDVRALVQKIPNNEGLAACMRPSDNITRSKTSMLYLPYSLGENRGSL